MRVLLAAAVLLFIGCSSTSDCSLITTPIGLFPSACVIDVPNGANVPDTLLATYSPCACPLPAPDCTLLPTPGGFAPKACVIEVPNGAVVNDGADGGTVITINGKVVARYPPCPCPRPDGG